SNSRSPAILISIWSPSFKPSASTTAEGSRTAKLFPHFATCISGLQDIHLLLYIMPDTSGTACEQPALRDRHGRSAEDLRAPDRDCGWRDSPTAAGARCATPTVQNDRGGWCLAWRWRIESGGRQRSRRCGGCSAALR